MHAALKILIFTFGAVCILIALTHIILGPTAIPGSVPVNATMDSEDRFYATLFMGFGMALIWCARDLMSRGRVFDALMLIFFLGGVSRLISIAQVGLPDPLFIFLGGVELVLPPLLWFWRTKVFGNGVES